MRAIIKFFLLIRLIISFLEHINSFIPFSGLDIFFKFLAMKHVT